MAININAYVSELLVKKLKKKNPKEFLHSLCIYLKYLSYDNRNFC